MVNPDIFDVGLQRGRWITLVGPEHGNSWECWRCCRVEVLKADDLCNNCRNELVDGN